MQTAASHHDKTMVRAAPHWQNWFKVNAKKVDKAKSPKQLKSPQLKAEIGMLLVAAKDDSPLTEITKSI